LKKRSKKLLSVSGRIGVTRLHPGRPATERRDAQGRGLSPKGNRAVIVWPDSHC
jgi:hypothetical protein